MFCVVFGIDLLWVLLLGFVLCCWIAGFTQAFRLCSCVHCVPLLVAFVVGFDCDVLVCGLLVGWYGYRMVRLIVLLFLFVVV